MYSGALHASAYIVLTPLAIASLVNRTCPLSFRPTRTSIPRSVILDHSARSISSNHMNLLIEEPIPLRSIVGPVHVVLLNSKSKTRCVFRGEKPSDS
jgi:hypothetical protein